MNRFLSLLVCLPFLGCPTASGPITPGAPVQRSPAEMTCETTWSDYADLACPLFQTLAGGDTKEALAYCMNGAKVFYHTKLIACIADGVIEPTW